MYYKSLLSKDNSKHADRHPLLLVICNYHNSPKRAIILVVGICAGHLHCPLEEDHIISIEDGKYIVMEVLLLVYCLPGAEPLCADV